MEIDPKTANVCGIRQKSTSYWWESNLEHGTGWSTRIRQAWTYRLACVEFREMIEWGWAGSDIEIVELGPKLHQQAGEGGDG